MERKLNHVAVPSSEITPESLYLSRRDFLKKLPGLSVPRLSWPPAEWRPRKILAGPWPTHSDQRADPHTGLERPATHPQCSNPR